MSVNIHCRIGTIRWKTPVITAVELIDGRKFWRYRGDEFNREFETGGACLVALRNQRADIIRSVALRNQRADVVRSVVYDEGHR